MKKASPGRSVALRQVGSAQTLPSGMIAGVSARRAGGQAGFNGPFFPPGDPLPAQADQTARGRRFDYPQGINYTYGPRQQQGQNAVSFQLLRRLAEPSQGGLDIIRLLIERRKAQMKAQSFRIVGMEKNDNGGQRARDIEAFFRKPDGKTRWRAWLSAILEDHFVIDAVAIMPRVTLDGSASLQQIDGATLDVLIDDNGRTPAPPLPAYQQILYGLPAVNYTTEELAYYMANPRSNKLYGFSPVEQMVGIITIALNRQLSILNYFTDGSVPDMLIGVPKEWNVDTIAQFQEWWDSVLAGNLAERRHARFYPGDMKPIETKGQVLENSFDEWMARIACFCFGISPQGFVKEMNRATSETAKETSNEEGLEPTKLFVKDMIDDLLERGGAGDLQLAWADEEIQDPVEKASFVVALTGGATGNAKPLITLTEGRAILGLPAATPAQLEELDPEPEPAPALGTPGAPGVPAKQLADGKEVPAGKSKVTPKDETSTTTKAATSRGGRALPPVRANRKLKKRIHAAISRIVREHLTAQRKAIVAHLRTRATKLAKTAEDDLKALLDVLAATPWDEDAQAKLAALVAALSGTASTAALDHVGDYIGGTDDDFNSLLQQANDKSIAWSQDRIGNLITNVDDTTKDIVNQMTADAIAEGLTNDELADELSQAFGFSPARSIMIARTETSAAESQGTLIGFKESGVVDFVEWFPDAEACQICLDNAADGPIPIGSSFASGDDAPPAHPNCECTLTPVVSADALSGFAGDSGASEAAD